MMRHRGRLRVGSPQAAAARVAATVLLATVPLVVLSGTALARATTHRGHSSPHPGWVKYYIVKPPHHGIPEYLYEIAQHTLGSGTFAMEIFKLNKGRLEPGGEAMMSPSIIKPGWTLVLPPNASGAGVHYGPLPVVTPAATLRPAATPSVTGPRRQRPASEHGSSRGLVEQAGIGGALIMLLLTIGLVVAGRRRKPATRPKSKPRRMTELDQAGHTSPIASYPAWLASAAEPADRYSPPLAAFAADDDDSPADSAMPAAPSWLGVVGSPADPSPPLAFGFQAGTEAVAGPPVQPASLTGSRSTSEPASISDDEPAWPDFLAPADDADEATEPSQAAEPPDAAALAEPPDAPQPAEPPQAPQLIEPPDHGEPAESPFSPAALRILGARPLRQRGDDDMPPQRHEVALGDDRIEVVLAEAPAASQAARSRAGNTWLAATPYLLWAPLPYDRPDDGLAFACIGAGDEGCLFIDLAAAPGAVVIDGDAGAAVRLAESIAHQLCAGAPTDQAIAVIVVGSAVPEPRPACATWVPTLRDLATAGLDSPPDTTDVVFCELRSSEDAFVLARHVGSSGRRIVPVALGHLPGAAWSFNAQPSPRLDRALPSLVS